ncbi:multidrug/pheromone exporter, ABC superfamily [Xylaria bambusicola]|uniref:multidrug/pheromone exporter, ABC superfamily n=1 Tax=Xylaria bambusicola TaxID=326684 RepID=UPI002007F522|nr:multidrug/pheromone exporter, ABC superfamily [Xylaria bambusicola]KAI0526220.1 multidrug/pheromone exporter, ABC superfamily [Xylaria bambusicola]
MGANSVSETEARNVSSNPGPSNGAGTTSDAEKSTPSIVSKVFRSIFRYFHLLNYADPTPLDYTLLIVGTISSIGAGIPFPILGILFGQLVDELNGATCAAEDGTGSQSPGEYQAAINQKVILVVAVALAQFALIYIYGVCWNLFGERLAHRLREKYLRSLLRQEVSFFDKLPAGEVSSRLSADITTIKNGTSEKVGVYLGVLALFITSYIIAFIKGPKLAGILVSLVPAFLIMVFGGGHYVGKYTARASEHIASASSIALESLSNVMVVHAFRANDRLEAKFASELRSAKRESIKKATAVAIQSGVLYFIAFAASGLAYWQGSIIIADVTAGRIEGASVGSIYTIIFILIDASIVISNVSPYLQIFATAAATLDKLQTDIDRQSKIDGTINEPNDEPPQPPELFEGDVRLENVAFTYPSRPDVPVIQDVSLQFPAGKTTAIVGLSGSGKSTVAGLLTRLYDTDSGDLFLDGKNIRDINVRQLRSFIGLVQQDPMLLNRSVLENIALGLVNSSRPEHARFQSIVLSNQLSQVAEAIREGQDFLTAAAAYGEEMVEIARLILHAADLADAGVFLGNLEFGLGTIVGPNGDLLSGGQKQRVALARALVKDPRILVLDEATSSLDSASEQRIQAAIEKASVGRTVISIAHRLATVRNAHKIVVMRNGRVIEEGNHSALMAKDADYAALVRLQNVGSETSSVSTARGSKLSIDLPRKSSSETDENNGDLDKSVDVAEPKEEDEAQDRASKEPQQTAWSAMKKLGSLARPHLLWLFLAFFGSLLVGGTYLGSALIFGNTIAALSPCNTAQAIKAAGAFFGLLYFVLAIVEFFANGTSWSMFGLVAEKILYVIRVLSFRSLFEQDLQWHQSESRTPSSLLSFITSDTAAIGGLTGSIIGTLFSVLVNFIGAIILAHIVAWKIAVVCLAIVPLMLGSGFMKLWIISRFDEKHGKAFDKSVGISVEAVNSIKTVAALSLEQEILATYQRSLELPRKEVSRSIIWSNVFLALSMSISNLLYALVYWWGSKQIVSGMYTQAQFFIVLVSLLVSAQLWGQFFTLAPEITRAGQAARRIFDLIDLGSSKTLEVSSRGKDQEEMIESRTITPKTPGRGLAVKFKQVKFSYPARPNRQILNGLNLDIPPGQFCALVGPSGAGKSTIVSLLERMYSIESGAIEVGGIDISAKKEAMFRDDIGLVPQDSVLFDGSVRFNVALGARPGAEPSDAEIEEACKLANIHDTIMALPDGYNTQCGNNGGQLSGGQRQRLSIARALVRKPRLLLLDESTSALDAESERLLQDGLEKATRDITVVAIAHRLHTIRRADTIFVIEDGRCVERGSHEELMARSESYRVNILHQTLEG